MLSNPKFEASYCRLFSTEVVGIIGESPAIDTFFVEFYRLFLSDKNVSKFFANSDMTHQIGMLKRSLFQLTSCWVLGKPSSELVRLAELHSKLKISPDLLDIWLEALLDTIAAADPEYDEATRLAWCWALAPGIFYMKSFLQGNVLPGKPHDSPRGSPVWHSGVMDPAGSRVNRF
jgi:truncated hemoglobin YjbI